MRILSLFATLTCGLILIGADEPKAQETLGARSPAGSLVLLDVNGGSHWVKKDGKTPADWPIEDGVMTVGKGDIMTRDQVRDFRLHLEFKVPYMPNAKGQARGNSGVYLNGRYELQVLDSYGLQPQDNDCGAIYKQIAPRVNACKPPLQWQTYDVTFHAARLENGKVARKARVTVVQNGINVIDDREIEPSPGGVDTNAGQEGPLLLQDHGNPVQYRNIWLEVLP